MSSLKHKSEAEASQNLIIDPKVEFTAYINDNLLPTFQSSTVQYFRVENTDKLEAVGCALLITHEQKYFVVTAAHVFETHASNYCIPLEDSWYSPGGNMTIGRQTQDQHRRHFQTKDNYDIAILELSNESEQELKQRYKFLPFDKIEINDNANSQSLYSCYGYPHSRTKKFHADIHSRDFSFPARIAVDFDYAKYGFDSTRNIAIAYDGTIRKHDGTYSKAPDLVGISGSGLWKLKPSMDRSGILSVDYALVGVIIEQVRDKLNKVVVATRIDVVTEVLRTRLNMSVPSSQIF